MNLQQVKLWVDIVSGVGALVVGAVAALWAYTKFVVERGLLPPTQLDVECNAVGLQQNKVIVEILLYLKNLGSAALIARDIRVDIRYMLDNDRPNVFANPAAATFGRLRFEHSLRRELADEAQRKAGGERGLLVVPHNTFVQPGVNQTYTYVTAVDRRATYVLVWASFQYAQQPSRLQRTILRAGRRLGLIQYSLMHVREPHTVERVFAVNNTQRGAILSSQPDLPTEPTEKAT